MRGRIVAGAVGLGCAGLMVLVLVTPASAGDRGGAGRMGGRDIAADCQQAAMETPRGGSGDVKLTTSVPEGAIVAPGDDIEVRLTWDPKAWSGDDLDMALVCALVQDALEPDLSAVERPAANDGVFEYRFEVPENIKPDCEICVQGYLAGIAAGGCPQCMTSDRWCFMSGKPRLNGPPPLPTPPVTQPPTPPATEPPVITPPLPAAPVPVDVPAEVAGVTATRPAPAPAPAPAAAPAAQLPRTGPVVTQLATAGGGLTLTLGGLAVIGGAGRRTRRRAAG